jgi:hypothetical protein
MPKAFDYDATLKDLFQRDRPTLLRRLSHGIHVTGFLNVELPRVEHRRVDLLVSLADGSLLHIEFQSARDRNMLYRMLDYWLLIKRQLHRPLRQVVMMVGQAGGGAGDFEEDDLRFRYEVIELRKIDAEELIQTGNHGDLALAVLAGGGEQRVREILERAASVRGPARDRLLLQVLILSGLRGISGKVEWKLKSMSVTMPIAKHPFLARLSRQAFEEGKAKGEAEGRAIGEAKGQAKGRAKGQAIGEAIGMSAVLRELLETKFGPLPKWAQARMAKARRAQFERWTRRVLTAGTLEAVIGPRQRNGA